MANIKTTLHPEGQSKDNLYPNILPDNIPDNAIDYAKLGDDVKSLLNSAIELHPSGTDTSNHILAYSQNKGIYIGTDTGHWYYWDGTQYVDGGVFQATEIALKEITPNKLDRIYADGIIGKNLFDKLSVTFGKYAYNGNVYDSANYSMSEYIEVENETNYYLSDFSNDQVFIQYYDNNLTFLSNRIIDNSSMITTPDNCYYVRISVHTNILDFVLFEQNNFKTHYEPYNHLLEANKIKNAEYVKGILSVNLLDKNSVENGKYAYNGNIYDNANYSMSEYIEIDSETNYYLSSFSNNQVFIQYYDENLSYISSLIKSSSDVITTPQDTKYVVLSCETSLFNYLQFELGSTESQYQEYGRYYLKYDDILNTHDIDYTKLTIKKDGTGDYTSLYSAMYYAKLHQNKRFILELYEGEYDMVQEIGESKFIEGTTAGLILYSNVKLIGIGNRDNIKIICRLPDIISPERRIACATLNVPAGGNVENITFIGNNLRYTIHPESGLMASDYELTFKDCISIYEGNDGDLPYNWGGSAYASGVNSGAVINISHCEFYGYNNAAGWSVHSNYDYDNPVKITIENCLINGLISFRSISSGVINQVIMNNNKINNINIAVTVENENFDFNIIGAGNSVVPYTYGNYVNNGFTKFSDEVLSLLNNTGNTIPKGSLVKITNLHNVEILGNNDDPDLFIGITLEDIDNNNYGYIKTNGYLLNNNFNIGDKIGIVNGELSVISTNPIAICNLTGYIKLLNR